MSETARNLGRRARRIRSEGSRGSRFGLVLIIVGAVLLVAAIVGAIAVNV